MTPAPPTPHIPLAGPPPEVLARPAEPAYSAPAPAARVRASAVLSSPGRAPAAAPAPLLRTGANAQRLAIWLYAIAAGTSWIGQTWAGVDYIDWAYFIPVWLQIIFVALPAAVLDLGGVATMAIADWRLAKGEKATFWRVLSFVWVGLAIGINVLGHRQQPLISAAFGSFGLLAFCMALGHTAARRRDALEALGLLPRPKPRYDDDIQLKEPDVVRLAERLVVEDNYGKRQALDVAREQVMASQHRDALADYLRKEMTRMHAGDGALAGIVVGATRFDLLADQVMAQFDLSGWAAYIGAQMRPPSDDIDSGADSVDVEGMNVPAEILRRVPSDPEAYEAWRWLWAVSANSKETVAAIARRHNISERQMHWIRKVGKLRLLDSPQPPVARLLAQAHAGAEVDLRDLAGQPAPRSLAPALKPQRQSAAVGDGPDVSSTR